LQDAGSTNFQDLSYHLHLPAGRLGSFSLFGFGGLSSDVVKGAADSSKWEETEMRYPSKFISNTYLQGLTHTVLLGARTQLKTVAASSKVENGYRESFIDDEYQTALMYRDRYVTKKHTVSTVVNHKRNAWSLLRAGAYVHHYDFDFYRKSKEAPDAPLKEVIATRGQTQLVQAFAQWRGKPRESLQFTAGLHYLRLLLNDAQSVEPRASVQWSPNRKQSLSLGYGMHSQVQPLGLYFTRQETPSGWAQPNKQLGLTKAHHFVFSYNRLLGPSLRLKGELYYQHLFNVPVDAGDSGTFSTLNIQEDIVVRALENKGKGRNYGAELSLEKYLSQQFYYTLSTSLYQSKYTAADGMERNTRFNGNFINTVILGKDFTRKGGLRTFGINGKLIHAGGYRTTPIDREQSAEKGYAVYREKEAYSLQNPAYFRADLRLSCAWNRKGRTNTLSLDIQNLTNRQNIFSQGYDAQNQTLVNNYQTGLIPVLNYKVEF
ncbi:MAG TPA: TonB-dependent receptor, partial [Chitinophagaceae bacterium]|nr:TonB-dependent receptor [Chitinophagaceae bacterium]